MGMENLISTAVGGVIVVGVLDRTLGRRKNSTARKPIKRRKPIMKKKTASRKTASRKSTKRKSTSRRYGMGTTPLDNIKTLI
jgi:hypothetical protein